MIPIYLVQVADSPNTTPLLHNLDPRQSFKKTIATVLFLLINFRLYSSKPRLQGFKTLLPLIKLSTPLNHLQLGQFGTVPYQHGHSQIASSHNALSKYMPGQTLRPLYSTTPRHLLYLEQSVSRLLEMFVPVQRIRDLHIRIPRITDRR